MLCSLLSLNQIRRIPTAELDCLAHYLTCINLLREGLKFKPTIKMFILLTVYCSFQDQKTENLIVPSHQDCVDLQGDLYISHIYDWSLRWQLQLSPSKCEALNITNKRSPIPFKYHIGSAPVTWCNKVKYLGVVITSTLKWNDHCQRVVHRTTQSLNRLRRAMYGYTELVSQARPYRRALIDLRL